MFFLNRVRKNIGYTLLRNKYKQKTRDKAVHNLHTADNALLVFQASGIINYNQLFDFEASLNKHNIETTLLGFVNHKRIPDILLFKKEISLISKKDLNFWFFPKDETTGKILNKQYDILIDFDIKGSFPLEYIVKLTNASFKIGPYNEQREHYDMMIHLDTENKINFYTDQLMHYLSRINIKAG